MATSLNDYSRGSVSLKKFASLAVGSQDPLSLPNICSLRNLATLQHPDDSTTVL